MDRESVGKVCAERAGPVSRRQRWLLLWSRLRPVLRTNQPSSDGFSLMTLCEERGGASGGRLRMLCLVGEFTRDCLTLGVAQHLAGRDVVGTLDDLFAVRGRQDSFGVTTARSSRPKRSRTGPSGCMLARRSSTRARGGRTCMMIASTGRREISASTANHS